MQDMNVKFFLIIFAQGLYFMTFAFYENTASRKGPASDSFVVGMTSGQ